MTDIEIDKALALAIGWKESVHSAGRVFVWKAGHLALFSYKDPAVIWPIAEKYECFPYRRENEWEVGRHPHFLHASTAAKAVALAVIGMNK